MSWTTFTLSIVFFLERIQMFGYYFDHHRFATVFDVVTMFLTLQVAGYMGYSIVGTFCKCTIAGALLMAWTGSTGKKQKVL